MRFFTIPILSNSKIESIPSPSCILSRLSKNTYFIGEQGEKVLTVEVFEDDNSTLKMKIFIKVKEEATIRQVYQELVAKNDKKLNPKNYEIKQKLLNSEEYISFD